jgi:hypothetical protein
VRAFGVVADGDDDCRRDGTIRGLIGVVLNALANANLPLLEPAEGLDGGKVDQHTVLFARVDKRMADISSFPAKRR